MGCWRRRGESKDLKERFSCSFICPLSVRYHLLHPQYIHERLKRLGKLFELRVLLVLADTVSELDFRYPHSIAEMLVIPTLTR